MRSVLIVFLFGLLLKFVLLPFAMHSDLLSMYFRAHLMSEYNLWNLPTNQFLAHLIYALNLKLMGLVGFEITSLFQLPFGLREGSMTSSVGDWLRFAENEQVNAALFWFKLPHLIVDSAVFVLLLKIFRNHRHRLFVLASWWLNPVNIYAFYIFSRHDVFTLIALMLAIIFASREKLLASALSVFAAIQIRVQPILLLPIFAISWWKNRGTIRQLIKGLSLTAAAILVYFFIKNNLPFDRALFQDLVGVSQLSVPVRLPSLLGIPVRHASQLLETTVLGIPIYLVLYAIVALLYFFKSKMPKDEMGRVETINKVLLVIMTLYFAVNPFSPHYFVWLSIFVTLAVAFRPRVLLWYSIGVIGWALMGIFGTDVTWFSQNLFVPVSTNLFRTPQLSMLVQTAVGEWGFSVKSIFDLGRLTLAIGMLGSVATVLNWNIRNICGRLKLLFVPAAVCLLLPSTAIAAPIPVLEQGGAVEKIEITKPIGQTFVSPVDSFGSIEVRLGTDRVEGQEEFVFRLKEHGQEEWIYENSYQRQNLYNGYYYPFGFPLVENAEGKEYYFELARPNYTGKPLYIFQQSSGGKISFLLIADRPGTEFIEELKQEMSNKIAQQKMFFNLYFLLLALTTALLLVSQFLPLRNK